MDRRSFLLAMISTAWPLAAGAEAIQPSAGSESVSLVPTPEQIEGPYYPPPGMRRPRGPGDRANDLTRMGTTDAQGVRLALRGRARTPTGQLLAGALIEIWQTCHRGRYLHPQDDWGSEIPMDPGFAYYGHAETDPDGSFGFLTVVPRRYPSGGQREWWRPPHVHLKVSHGRSLRLTTQLYFDDPEDPDNSWRHRAVQGKDRLLGRLKPEQRARLIVPLTILDKPSPADTGLPWGAPRVGELEVIVGERDW